MSVLSTRDLDVTHRLPRADSTAMLVGGTIWNLAAAVPEATPDDRLGPISVDDRQAGRTAGSTLVAVPGERVLPTSTTRPEVQVEGLRTWSGRVIAVEAHFFTAEVTPERGTTGAPIIADFEEGLLGRSAVVGDLFYMTKRVVESPDGRRVTHRSIALRRLGRWRADELDALREQARARAARIQRLIV